MENFFGLLKAEMFYYKGYYNTLDDLISAMDDYINYYNYERIKANLKILRRSGTYRDPFLLID